LGPSNQSGRKGKRAIASFQTSAACTQSQL
jgi:hypothetical protein